MNENEDIAKMAFDICSKTIGFDLSSIEAMADDDFFEYKLKHTYIDENGNEIWTLDEIKTPWKFGNKL